MTRLCRTDALVRFAAGDATAAPLAYVEAACAEPDEQKRQSLIRDAATRVAESGPDAFLSIADAFLTKRPRLLPVASDPESQPGAGESMSRTFGLHAARSEKLAPAAAPNQKVVGSDKVGPLPQPPGDGSRTDSEQLTAFAVLTLATRMSAELAEVALQTAGIVRRWARSSTQPNPYAQLQRAADMLENAARSAGTLPRTSTPTQVQVPEMRQATDEAMRAGASVHEIDAMLRFAVEYDQLCATGHAPKMTRERYVALNLEKRAQ